MYFFGWGGGGKAWIKNKIYLPAPPSVPCDGLLVVVKLAVSDGGTEDSGGMVTGVQKTAGGDFEPRGTANKTKYVCQLNAKGKKCSPAK